MTFNLWLIFLGGAFLSSVSPGAGTIITINHSFQLGWRHTLPLIAGQSIALSVMMPFIAFTAHILRTSNIIWFLLQISSVLWLIFMAYKTWHSPIILKNNDIIIVTSKIKRFFLGFITDITNVKMIIFLLTILPIFLNPNKSFILQITIMTITLVIVDTTMMLIYAIISTYLRHHLSLRIRKIQNRIFSIFLIFIAISICFIKLTSSF